MKSKLNNFTPLMDSLVERYDLITAAVYGRVWRYGEDNGYCYAAHRTIAEELGVSRETVLRKIKILIRDGYLEDKTPDQRNKPHQYVASYQAGITLEASAYKIGPEEDESQTDMADSHSAMAESYSDCVRKSHEETKKREINKERIEDSVENPLLETWEIHFPNKTQPRPATYKTKIATRLRNPLFRESWLKAMKKANKSPHLQYSGWFQLRWFVHNDENFQKILDGVFDSFDKQIGQIPVDTSNYQVEYEANKIKQQARVRALHSKKVET